MNKYDRNLANPAELRYMSAAEKLSDGYTLRTYKAGRDSSRVLVPRSTFDRGYEVRDPAGGLVGRAAYRDEAVQMIVDDRSRSDAVCP